MEIQERHVSLPQLQEAEADAKVRIECKGLIEA